MVWSVNWISKKLMTVSTGSFCIRFWAGWALAIGG